jgi:ribonuclease J
MRSGNILIADIGDTIELTANSIRFGEKFSAGSRFVDGMGIDDADSLVIRDRIHLAEDGLIVASVGISARSGQVKSIEILTKGLVLSDAIIVETKKNLAHLLEQIDLRKVEGQGELSNYISRALKNHLSKALKKNPMIIPMVVEI